MFGVYRAAFAFAFTFLVVSSSGHALAETGLPNGWKHVALQSIEPGMTRSNVHTVYFAFDSYGLDRAAKTRLDRQAKIILRHKKARFAVTGHTDKVGNERYNAALGLQRAKQVVAYLVRLGVPRSQLYTMVSMGEARPAVRTEDRERRNRRVTTTLLVPEFTKKQHGQAVAKVSPRQSGVEPATPATSTTEPAPQPTPAPTEEEPPTTDEPAARPGNSAEGTGRPDAGKGNGNEPSGDPGGSVGKNQGGDET